MADVDARDRRGRYCRRGRVVPERMADRSGRALRGDAFGWQSIARCSRAATGPRHWAFHGAAAPRVCVRRRPCVEIFSVEGREKRQVKKLFSRYVSKDVYDQLVANPSLAALGGARRHMTVLFSDIRGFTTMSEKGTPEDVVAQLNQLFTRMVAVVFSNRGTVDKFVGDMGMALYGAPLDDEDHAEHAVQTALAMIKTLQEMNQEWARDGKPQLDIGIGINTGDMIAGNVGSETIMNYTVIGDAVNLGARLESLNKEYGTRIIISEATRERLKGRYDIHPLGDVIVKGKSKPVAIFEVKPHDA